MQVLRQSVLLILLRLMLLQLMMAKQLRGGRVFELLSELKNATHRKQTVFESKQHDEYASKETTSKNLVKKTRARCIEIKQTRV
jgi:hypothetical protein